MSRDVRALLEGMVDRETLLPEADLGLWSTGAVEKGTPCAVLAPSCEEEMASVLARASREGWRVLPAGFGGWLDGGGPAEVSLILSTRRMGTVHEYEPADLTFTAGAGLSMADLRRTTEPYRQWLPLDPPGSLRGSLGAMVSLGMGGPLRQLHGTPRDHVLGLTMVSGDGRVLRWGGRVVKNVAGFDLTRLMVGSWGALGVITSVSARLFPVQEVDLSLVFRGRSLAALLPAARALALSGLPLAAIELVDGIGWGASGPDGQGGGASSPALVLRLLGSSAQVADMESRIRRHLSYEPPGPGRVEGGDSRTLHDRLAAWEDGAALVIRLSLLPSRLGVLLDEAEALRAVHPHEEAGEGGFRMSAHVGAGVLRIAITEPAGEADGPGPLGIALAELRSRLEARGGGLTLSRAPGFLMRHMGAWGSAGTGKEIMVGLKAQFDPGGILSPGRLGL